MSPEALRLVHEATMMLEDHGTRYDEVVQRVRGVLEPPREPAKRRRQWWLLWMW